MSESIEPFRVEIPREAQEDLRRRLEWTRFPDQIPGTRWEYGAEIDTVRELVAYWRDDFSWSSVEDELNALVLEHARKGVESCEPSGFVDWLPLTLAVRALAEARNGMLDEASRSLVEARRAMREPLMPNQQLLDRARQIIQQAQSYIQQRRADERSGEGGDGGSSD